MYPECRHVKSSGRLCDSPALSGSHWCYFHKRLHERQIALQRTHAEAVDGSGSPHLGRNKAQQRGRLCHSRPWTAAPVPSLRNAEHIARSSATRRCSVHPARAHRGRTGVPPTALTPSEPAFSSTPFRSPRPMRRTSIFPASVFAQSPTPMKASHSHPSAMAVADRKTRKRALASGW